MVVTEEQQISDSSGADYHFMDGGYARLSYVESRVWAKFYGELESVSQRFVSLAWKEGREGYPWPLDPLHWWSRTWEYPWIAAHIERLRSQLKGPRLLDIGAAVTFFTFYLQRTGFKVTNLDYDPAMPGHFVKVFDRVRDELSVIAPPQYLVADARDTGITAESFDLIVCVSVLEHIPNWERVLPEIHRLLAPGGYLILTFDVKQNCESDGLSTEDVSRLFDKLSEKFVMETREERQIPADAIDTINAPLRTPVPPVEHALPRQSMVSRLFPLSALPRKAWHTLKRTLPREPENITIYGGVWRKR